MSELRTETWVMPAADVGPENPLPPLQLLQELHAPEAPMPDIPAEVRRNMASGLFATILPYTVQDDYTRQRHPRGFRVAVLENEILRATFLLELGGRLWSLVHKPSGRELLEVNPVFQPANLALRNAWFSGGVEWNIGMTGHSPFTCSPIFAARVDTPEGTPILRLYEWERIRQVPFQIDAYLPDGSAMLLLRCRIANPQPREVPMYWWSNIAVPETPDTRVLAPAESAYRFGYTTGLNVVPIPYTEGTDISYTTRVRRTLDYFFKVPEGRRPWIAALDSQGKGLIQVSTDRLKGRKLFLWGTGTGGQNWQRFLSEPGRAYLEIQAGLAATQLERIPMPAGTEWTWLEGYGLMEADPAAVIGPDWARACRAVEDRLEALIPRAAFNAEYQRGAAFANTPPTQVLQRGSGWGALERLRREVDGEPPFLAEALPFDDESLGDAQQPWVQLLRDGTMPQPDPNTEPQGYLVQDEWRALLERSVNKQAENWFAWLHLGIMDYHADNLDRAKQSWQRSLAARRNPWALRNLAVLASQGNRLAEAAVLYVEAHRQYPLLLPLTLEAGYALIAAGQPQACLDMLAELPESRRAKGRVRLLEGQAALTLNNFAHLEALFAAPLVVDDLREGDGSLADLWYSYHERRLSVTQNVPIDETLRRRVRVEYPVPVDLDFHMTEDDAG